MKNGGWLDAYDEEMQLGGSVYPVNYVPQAENGIEGTMGGLTDKGFNYNGTWGGTMEDGGDIPQAQDGLLEKLKSNLNPKNWGVDDYSKEKDFNKAYSTAKKSGEKEFMYKGKRYNTKYAGTPRQEVGAYGVDGKPVNIKEASDPSQINLYPAFGKYLPGHASASVTNDPDAASVNYSSSGNNPFGLNKVENKGEHTYYVYGADKNKFYEKAASLPTGKYRIEDEYTSFKNNGPSDWNLFTNNCADNVCDAFGIPRSKGIQTPSGAVSKIKKKYPTIDVTGRTQEDYSNLVNTLFRQKDILKNSDKLTSIYFSPDTENELKEKIGSKIQTSLRKSGYDLPKSYIGGDKWNVDNIIGDETLNALKDWQNKNKSIDKKAMGGDVPQAQNGLWNTNKTQWVDSIHNARRGDLDFVNRYFDPSAGTIPTPRDVEGWKPGQTSTHLMRFDPGSRRVYPSVVNVNGKLKYLPGDDESWNYADDTKEFIEFPTAQQAEWYSSNGYKKGTNVLKEKTNTPKKAMGGNLPGATGSMYARIGAPSKGPRRNQTDVTDASAQNGKEMSFYQNGLDWTPKNISKNGSEIPQAQMGTMVTPLDFSKPLGTLEGVSEVMSAPARTATYLLTGKYQDPSQALGIKNPWGALAADMVLDPMNLVGAGVATKAAKAAKAATKASTETGALSKAYRYNPFAEKLNSANKSYRVAGMDAAEDFQKAGFLRSNPTIVPANFAEGFAGTRTTGFPSFQKGYADLRYLPEEGGVVFETGLPTFGRGDINPVTGNVIKGRHYAHRVIDPVTGKVLTNIPGQDIRMFEGKPHWLKGFKEVPKPKKKEEGGEITKDDNGYWNPENWGKPVEIGSNDITMRGLQEMGYNKPLLGISDTGDTQMMYPGEDYKFKGKKVTEYPVKKNGGWLEKYK